MNSGGFSLLTIIIARKPERDEAADCKSELYKHLWTLTLNLPVAYHVTI